MHTQPETLLVCCPNWVGDVVMATPALDCLRENFRHATLIGVMRNYVRQVVEDGPWFDHIVGCNDKTAKGFFRLVKTVRGLDPDMAIVLPNTMRSALVTRLAGINRIYGYRRNCRSLLLTGGPQPVRAGKGIVPVPMVNYYLEICRWLNLTLPQTMKPSLFLSDTLQIKGNELLARYGIQPGDMVIGMNPGAKFGSSKCWPPASFSKLAELFTQKWDCRILLFVGPGEDDIARSIMQASRAPIINTGPDQVDLALLKPLVKRCALLVTNDTGPRHYAVAFDIPVVVLMGPTDPRYTAANLDKTLVLREELDCSPCHQKKCPRNHECMRMISPEAVFRGSEDLLRDIL
ncbi:MAG: lipopolysaccharide heptosyltransferase II [Thermodesulfobacteriota bacterium]|nr:lipopolysaccharide heptosyltransferase II [Thermodesulfobacteriota bacterium]